jgi:hypothetical protein
MQPRKWKGTGVVIRGEIVGAGALASSSLARVTTGGSSAWRCHQEPTTLTTIPIDSVLIFPFAGSVLVYGREQLLL